RTLRAPRAKDQGAHTASDGGTIFRPGWEPPARQHPGATLCNLPAKRARPGRGRAMEGSAESDAPNETGKPTAHRPFEPAPSTASRANTSPGERRRAPASVENHTRRSENLREAREEGSSFERLTFVHLVIGNSAPS